MIYLILITGLLGVFLYWYFKKRKKIVINQVNLVTGAPKTGKTVLSLSLALKDYKKRLLKTKIKNFFRKLFNKPLLETPLFYSTIPVGVPYVELTEELLMREKRFRYNSVIFIDEAYLVADSMAFKDDNVNESLSLFNKLIGHELHGGSLFYNTQNVHDVHFAIKRCSTTYIFIESKENYPLFLRLNCRELVNSEEVPIVNTTNCDLKDDPSFHMVLVPKKYFKLYDCYALSELTDNLPVEDRIIKTKKFKTNKIVNVKNIIKKRKELQHEKTQK